LLASFGSFFDAGLSDILMPRPIASSVKRADIMRTEIGLETSAWIGGAAIACLLACSALPVSAKGTGLIFVTNEKSSTLTVLDRADSVIATVPICARPRGIAFNPDRSALFVGCSDDDTIGLYDIATLELKRRYRGIPDPETFDLHPDGRHLLISNEDDSEASVLDTETGEIIAHYATGEEPEGVLITPDGHFAFVASEAANLVHVIDVEAKSVVKSIIVDTRPRRFALTPDEKQLWVSAELSGVVDIIDLATLEVVATVSFLPKGMRKEQVTPVDVVIAADGKRAYVALGRANHVAVVDVASREVIDYVLVGKRPWGLRLTADGKKLYVANGLSDDIVIIDTASNTALTSIPVGQVPYAILIDDE
jgi:PQQ-dependent catabolism-associated beta-propeller protein